MKKSHKSGRAEGVHPNFISALRGFVDEIVNMERKGETEVTRSEEIKSAWYSASYNYHVRSGVKKEDFLWPPKKHGKMVRIQKPPIKITRNRLKDPVDIFDKGDSISVTASLPKNIKDEDLKFKIVNDTLNITVKTSKGKVEKNISLPEGSSIDKIENVSFKNGVLEIELRKKEG
ncbi:MAG: Hsp20/alpha crystallin family protein [Thermoplasmatales archaeon]|nr:Hsp20/alpha crystallin family protein [Thermoplasmatales archaeon]